MGIHDLKSVEASITAQNTFTDAIVLYNKGYANFSLSGTWAGTVTVQRKLFEDTSWKDVKTYTANAEKSIYDCEFGVQYRAGIKTGEYTSGTAVIKIVSN